jgi:hypothetical protein
MFVHLTVSAVDTSTKSGLKALFLMETSSVFCALTDAAVTVAIKRTNSKIPSVFLLYQLFVFPYVFTPTIIYNDTI